MGIGEEGGDRGRDGRMKLKIEEVSLGQGGVELGSMEEDWKGIC